MDLSSLKRRTRFYRWRFIYTEGQKNIRVTYIDLEQAYYRLSREEIWRCSRERNVPEKYIRQIQDMYAGMQNSSAQCGRGEQQLWGGGRATPRLGIKPIPVPTHYRCVDKLGTWINRLRLLSCHSHNFFPLAGACLCPLCHWGQVVSRTMMF